MDPRTIPMLLRELERIYTALRTARLNGIDPEAWLADVLNQLARGRSQLDLDPLMPWNWRKTATLAIAA